MTYYTQRTVIAYLLFQFVFFPLLITVARTSKTSTEYTTHCTAQGTLFPVVAAWMGGESGENGHLCMCTAGAPFALHLRLSQHC